MLDLRDEESDEAIASLANLIRRSKSLRHLDLSNCCLNTQHAQQVKPRRQGFGGSGLGLGLGLGFGSGREEWDWDGG